MADCIGAQLHPQADCIGRGPQQQPTASDANSPPKTITANDFMTNSWVTGILSATRGMREERGDTRFWVVVQGQFDAVVSNASARVTVSGARVIGMQAGSNVQDSPFS